MNPYAMLSVTALSAHFSRPTIWCGLLAVSGLVTLLYWDTLVWAYDQWTTLEEYSHGLMIPFVTLYLCWQRRDQLDNNAGHMRPLGIVFLLLGLSLFLVSSMAAFYSGAFLSLIICVYGIVLSTLGWLNFKVFQAPLLMLLFMVPLPAFVNNNLSSELQLISSQLGVAFIRLFDIGVYLEGNVIDLGSYKLQVVDACSGLRYLYPLVALGFILTYLVDMAIWKKVILFLATIPITVIMNSLRIGGIGVTVEYWGPEMAEGILHDIEGWFMFMASLSVLLALLKLMLIGSGDRRSLGLALSSRFDRSVARENEAPSVDAFANENSAHKPMAGLTAWLFFVVVLLGSAVAIQISNPTEAADTDTPPRLGLTHFPLIVGDWLGTPDAMEKVYIDALKFDDYIIANYSKDAEQLNFYIAYYGSQSAGQSAHSPRSCIPGGGWRIESLEQIQLGELYLNSQPLVANRAVIQKGEARQVVYYWFQQRGRTITNEYLVKWYLFVDALFEGRTDGALVRLSLPLDKSKDISHADALATDFMSSITYRINDFVPN